MSQFTFNLRRLQDLLDGRRLLQVVKTEVWPGETRTYGPRTARSLAPLTPRMRTGWIGEVLVQLKVYDGWTNDVVVYEDGTWTAVNWDPADAFPPPGGVEFAYSDTIQLFEDGTWSPIAPYDPATDGWPPPADSA